MNRGRERGRSGGRGQGRGNCFTYKFLGECEKHRKGECRFRHEFVLPNPCSESVPVPKGISVDMVIGSGGCNMKQLRSIAECHIDVNRKRVQIITDNKEKLQLLVEKLKIILSQLACRVYPVQCCFIHPQALPSHGLHQFRPYRGTKVVPRAQTKSCTMYEIRGATQERDIDNGEGEIVTKFAALSSITSDDTPKGAEGTEGTRMQFSPQENIKTSLTKCLSGKRQQKFIMRLEARFGRMTWGRFPESVYDGKYSVEKLADLLFAENSKHSCINIFNTDVKATNADNVRIHPSHRDTYALETLNVKLTTIIALKETKLDACLLVKKNDDGSTNLKVLMVTKNDIKDANFNILNLHREHDVRIRLNHCECARR